MIAGAGPHATENSTGCSDFDVRLVGSNNSYMGIVEACYSTDTNSSLWGPICASSSTSWTKIHATTVCTQLGFPSSGMQLG